MILFPTASPNRNLPNHRKAFIIAAGVITTVGTGTLIVRAAENPRIQQVMAEFNRPIRAALEPLVVRREQPLAEVQRMRERRSFDPVQAQGHPEASRLGTSRSLAPSSALAPAPQPQPSRQAVILPTPALPATTPLKLPPPQQMLPAPDQRWTPRAEPASTAEPRGRVRMQSRGIGKGTTVATNYCVRLCDGFAFPVGHTGVGQQVQEVACRQACPGAQTALYTLPAGAQDLSVMSRGGAPYTALPTAFRYQQKVSQACTCNPVGSTQSANAFYRDMTLKPGDVIMTGAGAQHFDGAARFPYKPTNFAEAVKRLTVQREVAIVRAMETASVRGVFSPLAPPSVKARIVSDLQKAAKVAEREQPNASPYGHPKGFVDLHNRVAEGRTTLPVVRQASGLLIMN